MAEQKIVPETVAELRDGARCLLEDEHDRANSFHTRASALAGFVGVLLSVGAATTVALGKGGWPELSDWGTAGVLTLLGGAVLAFGSAVVLLLFGVLNPSPGTVISTQDTDRFTNEEFTGRTQVMTQGYFLVGYTRALKSERARNDYKGSYLKFSYLLVLVGLGFLVLAGATAIVDRHVGGDTGEPEPGRGERAVAGERATAGRAVRVISARRGESVSRASNGGAPVLGGTCLRESRR